MAYPLKIWNGTEWMQVSTAVSDTSGFATTTDFPNTGWISYTPTWTADTGTPAIGNGGLTGRYKQLGKVVFFSINLVGGSTTNWGTGTWMLGLPVPAANDYYQFAASGLDSGIAWYNLTGNGGYKGVTTYFSLIGSNDDGTKKSSAVSNTFPFTWGAADRLTVSGSYEAA